jgi:hypothetical protein
MLAPAAIYGTAVQTMEALPTPSLVTFDETLSSDRGTLRIGPDADGKQALLWDADPQPGRLELHVTSRPLAGNAGVTIDAQPEIAMNGVFFDPSFRGVEAFLRGRVQGNELFAGLPPPSPSGVPEPAESPDLPVIASVSAIAPQEYVIADAGEARCPNGAPGHALHLTSRSSQRDYPLQAVTIDNSGGRFCSMTFAVPSFWEHYATTATYEIHFGLTGPFWLVTDGAIHFSATRPLHGTTSGIITFALARVQASP